MSIKPNFFKPYHISDIAQGSISNDGKRTFRGYGSDTTDRTDNIIYIGSPALQRVVALKAFLESYKLNLTKETDIKKEADKQSHVYTEYTSDLNFSLTLNIPAHSTNESRNNLAKLEELQRLIAPLGGPGHVHGLYGTKNNYFSVWFKNLIHSGEKYSAYPTPAIIKFKDLMKHGFFCYIDDINYTPDMSAGFFEFDDVKDGKVGAFLFPRNIKLSLTLKYGVEFAGTIAQNLRAIGHNVARPLYAFSRNGHYATGDNGRFPFGTLTKTPGFLELVNGPADYSTSKMNEMDYRLQGGGSTSNNSFLFISLGVEKDGLENSAAANSTRKRWVKFKGFIDSFNRSHKVKVPLQDGDKSRVLGNPMDMDAETTFESLDYSMKIMVPSSDISEAKKNCAKIQYLMRMFFKKYTPSTLTRQSVDIGATKHALKFYSPSFIESPNTTKYFANDFKTMYNNSLDLFMTDLGIDIDIEAGFFQEKGYLWPKVFTVDLKMSYMSDDLIKNYSLSGGKYEMLPSSTHPGKEHLFPFARQTSKIKIGGN